MRWGLFLLLAAGLTGYAHWVYRRAELPVPGAGRLAALRSVTLVLVLLLLFDPALPAGESPEGHERWVLLDVSASMGAAGGRAWSEALDRARALAEDGWRVVAFGDGGLRVVSPDSLGPPSAPWTRLAPALERAAETGVAEVKVVSDFRLHDRVEVEALLASVRTRVSFERVGGIVPDVALTALSIREPVRSGEPVRGTVRVTTRSPVGDSLTVEVREEDRLVGARTLEAPAPGLARTVDLELPPPADTGRVRYSARVLADGDGFAGDDVRSAYVSVDRPEGAVVLVSLRPDWEPRFLLPVLGRVAGLETRGYLRVSGGRYVPVGSAVGRGAPVSEDRVRSAVEGAAILVVQGVDAPPAWLERALSLAPRAVVLASGPDLAGAVGAPAGAPVSGEWYVSPELPPSPLAGELQGVRFQNLPPLSSVLPLAAEAPGAVPLRLRLRGSGPGRAALTLVSTSVGRRVVTLSTGLWRWAMRGGSDREVYRRLWSGIAGWLLARGDAAVGREVRPRDWVVPARQPILWHAGAGREGPVTLRIFRADTTVLDTVLAAAGGTATSRELPSGTYAFTAVDADGARVGSGRFDVSAYVDEIVPTADLEAAAGGSPGGRSGAGAGRGSPLRTLPWPYLLILVLLGTEWVVRRRIGLR